MKQKILIVFLFIISFSNLFSQHTLKLMTYNLLNYPGNSPEIRNQYFSVTLSAANPDILVVQEMLSQAGVNLFLNNVLLPIDTSYKAGVFIDGPDSDNAIFYKSNYLSFVSNTRITTTLRDINEFKLVHKITLDTLRIFSVHLKASTGSDNELQRLSEVNALRNYTISLPSNSNYIVLGDFNIYGSNEPAYQRLLDQSTQGYFIDVITLTGTWNNSAYAIHHTQSTRTRSFGGGATGGLDDRFDMILFSPAVIQSGGITYVSNSYSVYGNDGLHYNDSINRPSNLAVGQIIADALHYASDHLPVIASLKFESELPVELSYFLAEVIDNSVLLKWETATEINNYGFIVERKINDGNKANNWFECGFVHGNGNSNSPKFYSFKEDNLNAGKFLYRLKQIDNDGAYKYYDPINVEILPKKFELNQNFPNPFNSQTIISYHLQSSAFVKLLVYDTLGNEVETLVNQVQHAGSYTVNFNAKDLSSGLYYYRIIITESGKNNGINFQQTKKMVLSK